MKRLLLAFFSSALLWGGLATFGFYAAIDRGVITNDLVIRYTAGHPVEYVTVAMFLIGMVGLFFKYLRLIWQRRSLALGPVFPPIRPEKEDASRADEYLATIEKAREIRGETLHLNRLRKALTFLKSTGKADELDQELRCLSEEDAFDAEADYGMARMFIWAIPILGFLGTVIGITVALGNLDLTELETSGELLASGLKVAFDTTALALSLVFVLYFFLFFVQRNESKLFVRIDRLVDGELKGRFVPLQSPREREEFRTVRRMLKTVAESFENIMKAQVARWEEAIERVGRAGGEAMVKGAEQINVSLRSSLQDSVAQHARMMIAGEEKMLSETLAPYVRSMKENTERLSGLQSQMTDEGKVFREILRATGEVAMLEDRLNRNLRALSESNNFSETVNSLAAAIHLLNGKLGGGNYRLSGPIETAGAAFDGHRLDETADDEADSVIGGDADEPQSARFRIPASDCPKGLVPRKRKKDKSA